VKGPEHSSPFSAFASAKAKILLLGPSNPSSTELIAQARSLHLEHVSPALLVQQEISRRTRSALPRDVNQFQLALLRKWFWARKPDEWLEARGEILTACFASETTPVDLVTYYRTQGLTPVSLPAAA
jgi:adenylate kinase